VTIQLYCFSVKKIIDYFEIIIDTILMSIHEIVLYNKIIFQTCAFNFSLHSTGMIALEPKAISCISIRFYITCGFS